MANPYLGESLLTLEYVLVRFLEDRRVLEKGGAIQVPEPDGGARLYQGKDALAYVNAELLLVEQAITAHHRT